MSIFAPSANVLFAPFYYFILFLFTFIILFSILQHTLHFPSSGLLPDRHTASLLCIANSLLLVTRLIIMINLPSLDSLTSTPHPYFALQLGSSPDFIIARHHRTSSSPHTIRTPVLLLTAYLSTHPVIATCPLPRSCITSTPHTYSTCGLD